MAKVLVVHRVKAASARRLPLRIWGAALASAGKNVVLIDFDVGLRNLDLVMAPSAAWSMIYQRRSGRRQARASLIRDKRCRRFRCFRLADARQDALSDEAFACHCRLKEKFDWVSAIALPASSGAHACHAPCRCRDRRDQPRSVLGSRLGSYYGLLDSKTERAEKGERVEKHLLLTRSMRCALPRRNAECRRCA